MASWNQVSNVVSAVTSHHFEMIIIEWLPLTLQISGIMIYLVTWNVHGSSPPSHLDYLLSLHETQLPDVYAIG
ncbi:unnamed protein product, partial [Candidula unifasciata]